MLTEEGAAKASPIRVVRCRPAAVALLSLLAGVLLVVGGHSGYASSGPVDTGSTSASDGGGSTSPGGDAGSTLPATTGLADVVATAGGALHSLALRADGTVFGWGNNDVGQLGNGTTTNSSVPVQVCATGEAAPCQRFLDHVIAVAAGGSHSMALRSDGTVFTWGDNSVGQLGNGTTTNATTPVQVCATGETAPCQRFLTGVIGIAAGGVHSMALLFDGAVRTWGFNTFGQLGNGTTTPSTTPVQVCSTGESAPCQRFLDRVIAVAAGVGVHSMALLADGTVRTWGSNTAGQLGDGTTTNRTTPVQVCATVAGKAAPCKQFLEGVKAISAGGTHSMALLSDGTVRTWGLNNAGQLGDGTTTNRTTPVQVCATGATEPCSQFLNGVKAIAAGGSHSMALLFDSTVRTWGLNVSGQLGDGTTTNRTTPVQVCATGTSAPCSQFLNAVKAIAAGGGHSLAVLFDGTVRSWGQNSQGQLGDGTTTNRTTPVQVVAPAQDTSDPADG